MIWQNFAVQNVSVYFWLQAISSLFVSNSCLQMLSVSTEYLLPARLHYKGRRVCDNPGGRQDTEAPMDTAVQQTVDKLWWSSSSEGNDSGRYSGLAASLRRTHQSAECVRGRHQSQPRAGQRISSRPRHNATLGRATVFPHHHNDLLRLTHSAGVLRADGRCKWTERQWIVSAAAQNKRPAGTSKFAGCERRYVSQISSFDSRAGRGYN